MSCAGAAFAAAPERPASPYQTPSPAYRSAADPRLAMRDDGRDEDRPARREHSLPTPAKPLNIWVPLECGGTSQRMVC